MIIYISGPMTGKELLNFPAFFEAEKALSEKGYTVLNPASSSLKILSKKLGCTINEDNYQRYITFFDETDRPIYMQNDIEHVLDADAIALLPGWWTSRGAIVEMKVARECGKLIYEYNDGELIQLDEKSIGMKLAEKPRMELVDMAFVEDVARVLGYGANKYGEDSWKNVPDGLTKYLGAILRHATAVQRGEYYDSETGLSHAAHIACNAMFLDYFINKKKKEVAGERN